MRVLAPGGNRLHAPENTRIALIAAYTAGAGALEVNVRLCGDGHVVAFRDPTLDRLTGSSGRIADMTLSDLRKVDASRTFRPRGSTTFRYRAEGRAPVQMETLPELLDILPRDVPLIVNLMVDLPGAPTRDELVARSVRAIRNRSRADQVILTSSDADTLRLVRSSAPDLRVAAFGAFRTAGDPLDLMTELRADGLLTDLSSVLRPDGGLTELGKRLEEMSTDGRAPVGAILRLGRDPAVFTKDEWAALQACPPNWSVESDSTFDVAPYALPWWQWVDETFAGTTVNTHMWALGYAKANRYCHVFQDDGIHVKIEPFDKEFPAPDDPVLRRLQQLEEELWYVARDWPFYSGGGVGLVQGLPAAFAAEVGFEAERASQATMLEMAVVNAEPGAHHPPWNPDGSPNLPRSFRDKDVFFDPHGAPPFVGVEHDEDDGYRINWNAGTDYDNNQYGKPSGDGRVLSGRLRLERRGPYFSAYYRNDADATDWVCVGVARNDSLNPTVFLRCAGKRWRQEVDAEHPDEFFPVVPNHIVFRDLSILRTRPPAPGRGAPDGVGAGTDPG
jgi:glycerophosphoryl diester phosphodiesterase